MNALPEEAGQWIPETVASKLGPVPVLYIGRTRKESLDSCNGCSLLRDKRCYAQFGTPGIAHSSVIRAWERGKDYSLGNALLNSSRKAKMARFTAVGDISSIEESVVFKWVKAIRDFGLDVVGYLHMWRDMLQYAGVFMASCDDLSEVDEALELGFRATTVLPHDFKGRRFTTKGGAKGIVCPAILSDKVTCNTCRLCDASKPGPVVGFPDHGPKHRHKTKSTRVKPSGLTTKQEQVIESLTGGQQ